MYSLQYNIRLEEEPPCTHTQFARNKNDFIQVSALPIKTVEFSQYYFPLQTAASQIEKTQRDKMPNYHIKYEERCSFSTSLMLTNANFC